MKILIKLDKRLYKYAKHHTLTSTEIDEICDVIANGTPLPEGAEILTKEAYSDLCRRAADVPDFESEGYIKQRLENYNKLLKSGMLDCVKEKSQESEDKLDGDPVDIDKAVEHYEGTLETLKGIDLEVDG